MRYRRRLKYDSRDCYKHTIPCSHAILNRRIKILLSPLAAVSTLGQLLLARDILQTNTCGVTVSRASTLRDLSMLKNEDSAFRHSLLYARHHVAVFVYHYTSCDTRVITWQSSPSAAALMPETTGPCWGRRHTPLRLWELCIEPLFKLQLGHVHDFLSHELWIEKIYNQSTYYNPSKK